MSLDAPNKEPCPRCGELHYQSKPCLDWNMTDLPPSKMWYALDRETDEVIDKDTSLILLDERIKLSGRQNDVVYSKYRIEKVPRI